ALLDGPSPRIQNQPHALWYQNENSGAESTKPGHTQFPQFFWHCWQRLGISPGWIRWCKMSSEQEEGFSPVWVLRCVERCSLCRKLFPQHEQAYGLSPVWMRWWTKTLELEEKRFPHVVQRKDFSLVCVLW
uniref:Uncharacterized protein n=1 Tax=Bubo bubo TaxID=30461 RepID=A0A8C0I885_BUBBB